MSATSTAPSGYMVQGRNEYHDQGTKFFSACRSEAAAADRYLREYVEDWRGGFVSEITLWMSVWPGAGSKEQSKLYRGMMMSPQLPGSGEPTYKIEEVSNA